MHCLNLSRKFSQPVRKFGCGLYSNNLWKSDGRFLSSKKILKKNNCFVTIPLIQNRFLSGYSIKRASFHGVMNDKKFLKCYNSNMKMGNSLIFHRFFHISPRLSASDNEKASSNSGKDPNKEDDDEWPKSLFKSVIKTAAFYFCSVLTIISLMKIFQTDDKNEVTKYVSWNEFLYQMLAKGEVDEVLVRPNINIVSIFLREGAVIGGVKVPHRMFLMNITDVGKFEYNLREAETSLGIRPEDGVKVVYDRSFDENAQTILTTVFAVGVILFLLRHMSKGASKMSSQFFSMGRAKYTFIDPLMPGSGKGVKLSDVAGAQEAKQEVMEFVDFLKNPEKYQRLGARVPKGALLLGPPGCGKTLLAKAVATEGSVPFLSMNGSEFVEVIGGLGAARVRDLFKQAKSYSPCIIYIDEIDAIGRQRGGGGASSQDGGSGESEQTLNQLLVEMDGILSKEGVLLLASTNRLDILDRALLRPGRFDRQIMMGLPTQIERCDIFKHHLKQIKLEHKPEVYASRMASLTLGFTGADIANVVNEAALYAARIAKKIVTSAELEYAIERVIGGTEKKSTVLSPDERRVVAYHEAGHALMGWLLEHTDALLKVTIVPRTNQTLGFAQYSPKDKQLHAQDELFEKMCMALGGRVAESLIFNKVTNGAQNDLEKVTQMAYAQVRSFGFSPIVGHISFPGKDGQGGGRRPYSNKLANTIDKQASALIFRCYKKTEETLTKNIDKLTLLAESLIKKETLNYNDVKELLGPPTFDDKNVIEPLQFEGEIKQWKDAGKTE